ncbi:hypothetical protein ESCO_000122 [Escovopsis weberi]|uniref:Uncharacterized protein n=1 Tax=Escovopsis weberi TaxID=150374 RepID=A0A0M8MY50_ESCWE|nr:hypothetical protein ESCO_000122 [Escovopsis weberi]
MSPSTDFDFFNPPLPDEALTQLLLLLSPSHIQAHAQHPSPLPIHPSLRRGLPSAPRSCPAHTALSGHPVRALGRLIARECAAHAARFRPILALGHEPPARVEGWLARCDALAGIAGQASRREHLWRWGCGWGWECFGIPRPGTGHQRCSACALSVVGGSLVYLADLRAGLLARARYHAYKRSTRGRRSPGARGDTKEKESKHEGGGGMAREPRLLRVVERWISLRTRAERAHIHAASEAVAASLLELRGVPARFGLLGRSDTPEAEAEAEAAADIAGTPVPVPTPDADGGHVEGDGLWTSRADIDSLSRFFAQDPPRAAHFESSPQASPDAQSVYDAWEEMRDAMDRGGEDVDAIAGAGAGAPARMHRASAVPRPLAVDAGTLHRASALAHMEGKTWI